MFSRRGLLGVFAGVTCPLIAYGADTNKPAAFALWDRTTNLRGGVGYKDNVVLSRNNAEESAFWLTGLDFSLVRLSTESGPNVSFFFSGDDRRYFSADAVNKEQLFLAQARLSWEIGENWETGSPFTYSYIDEIFDASATEQVFETIPVKAHRFGVAPYVSRRIPWDSELELKFNLDRQLFNEPLDDYWEFGPQLTWSKSYGHRSDVSVSYAFRHRPYDTRHVITLNNEEIPESSLHYQQHEFEGILNHVWDEGRVWRTRTRLSFTRNDDNGPGFFDYHRYRLAQRLSYYGEDWQASVEGKILHYDYLRQPVVGGTEVRNLWEYILALRVERNLLRQLKLFVESEHEWVDSNNLIEEYHVNTVMSGVDWEF